MPLPFTEYKEGSASLKTPSAAIKRKPDEEGEPEEYDSMEAAAEDLCRAIESKDFKALAEALRAAFELMDSEPHEEGPHE